MALILTETKSDFELAPEGTHPARCYRLIDLGTQTSTGQYGTKSQPKVMLSFELLGDEKMADGKPFSISSTYTASLHEKSKFRKDLVSWRGRDFTQEELAGFDISKLVGAPCLLNVVHTHSGDTVYANIATIMRPMSGLTVPNTVNDHVLFDLSNPNWNVFDEFSEKLKTKIMASPEYQKAKNGDIKQDVPFDDDIGF